MTGAGLLRYNGIMSHRKCLQARRGDSSTVLHAPKPAAGKPCVLGHVGCWHRSVGIRQRSSPSWGTTVGVTPAGGAA
jgi:hypothetical protein